MKNVEKNSVTERILAKPPKLTMEEFSALFDKPIVKDKTRIPKYFPNPEPNWGPKKRAHKYLPYQEEKSRYSRGQRKGR
jgi:hypothetical protein